MTEAKMVKGRTSKPRPRTVRTDAAIPEADPVREAGRRPLEMQARKPRPSVQDDPSLEIWFLD
jgi:hypothetical protein